MQLLVILASALAVNGARTRLAREGLTLERNTSQPSVPTVLPAASPSGSSMAFVHLFEWKWDDVAEECETFLGPKGFTAVQISPPNEHMSGGQWWTRYQPVTYKLVSRSGDEAAFASMVQRCKAAGVGIYVDAVINHMAAGGGTGIDGSQYGNRNFPNYSPDDFHHLPGDKYRNCAVDNYQDKHVIQYCDLVGLADLCTGCPSVQEKIAGYINSMKKYGISGFRVDAAKHIDAGDLGGILGRVGDLFRFLEVIGHGHEAVTPDMYYHLGHVTEFNFATKVSDNFQNSGKLQYLRSFGESWGLMPHRNAVTFIDNHDTQRGHAGDAPLTYKSGSVYRLASIFMLAHPYGYPKIMSSYYFDNTDAGPPGRPVHDAGGVNCGSGREWVCEHRWPALANMVAWRRSAGDDLAVSDWASPGPDQIAFCRGGRSCVAFNRMEHDDWDVTLRVSVPPGDYCNVIKSDASGCEAVRVAGDGTARVRVAPMDAVAFHVGAMADGSGPKAPTPDPRPTTTASRTTTTENPMCAVAETQRLECGHYGIDERGCADQGCCWRAAGPGVPWCYHESGYVPVVPPAPENMTCELAEYRRQECGHYGIDERGCAAQGCCWHAASAPGVPWCFKHGEEAPAAAGQCGDVSDASKRDCGWYGVDQRGCESKGCCWAASTSGAPWCFIPP